MCPTLVNKTSHKFTGKLGQKVDRTKCGHNYKISLLSILIKVLFVCVCIRHTFCGKFKGFVNYISVVISIMLLLFQITFILVKWLLLFQIIFSHKMFSDQVCKQKAARRTWYLLCASKTLPAGPRFSGSGSDLKF